MKKISLNSNYTMSANDGWLCCTDLPCSDFGALIKYCSYDNPLVCKNPEKIVENIGNSDYFFESEFVLSGEEMEYEHIMLCCDKIDTLCKCYINGKLAFESSNAYIPVKTEVKPLLIAETNKIRFELAGAVSYIQRKQKDNPLIKNNNGIDGAAYIRKPACHFGWDWGPCVPYKYIGNVEIQCYNTKIEDISIKQEFKNGCVCVSVYAENMNECYIISPDGDKFVSDDFTFKINNPKLWYTRDLSETNTQPLYTVIIKNDEMTVEKKIGLRTIKLNQSKDEYGTNFQFVLNGKRIFAKGANVIPFAAIPEDANDSTVDYYLDLCVKSNFNMLRIWGGGDYASEYLLSRCDELGILVWQDFCYACLMYPFYETDFLQNCLKEAEYQVKRMTAHPCLALWCGNNELEAMFSYLPKNSKIMKAYTEFFYKQLPECIDGLTDVDYIPTSPLGEKPFSKNTADSVGDTHMWNVWHGLKPLDYYRKRYTRFLSEFGLESLPSINAIREFAEDKDFDLKSDAFMSHQKCAGGNQKMLFYLKERFDEPKHFNDLPYLTGIVQAECVENAAEHFRQNKGQCNGALFWQLNDVWCCPSWSSVDFTGVPKALMFKAKQFFAPVAISYSDGKLYIHNDTMYDKQLKIRIIIMNGEKVKLDIIKNVSVKADSTVQFANHTLDNGDVLKASFNGNSYYFDNVKKLEPAEIKIFPAENGIILKSSKYARNIFIDCDDLLEDNYFCILPNEEKFIRYNSSIENISVKCENNIEFKGNKIKKALSRFLYRLKPMNIANAFYYEYN
ncbi:MAG: glycoside hydrolase family 2 protein [Eubacterium sp.]